MQNKLFSKLTNKQNLKKLIIQFIKFGLVGGINTVLSYAITNIGYYILNLHAQVSNLIAFVITVLISFLLNNKFVFKKEDSNKKRGLFKSLLKVYVSYSITGLFLMAGLLFVEESLLGIPHYIATLMNLIITIPLNFILNKFWAFK
ncbi:MAG: GtrA family protein [Clostridia bacterium]|nr:GtrA family protein [Clostridia bacterium]